MTTNPSRRTALSMAIGERLGELRRDAEMTQQQIADRMRTPRPVVNRMEHGRHTLSLESLWLYAKALELDLLTVLALVDVDGLYRLDNE